MEVSLLRLSGRLRKGLELPGQKVMTPCPHTRFQRSKGSRTMFSMDMSLILEQTEARGWMPDQRNY